ncbi:MAG: extracellular solute-binding protein, partial [Actinomycetota bacterium]|nr:extracellular solute-binding protein [Actinomycetota bacterium]
MKNTKTARMLSAVGLSVTLALTAAGCAGGGGGGGGGSNAETTTLWRLQDNAEGPLKDAAARFNETSEVGKVEYSGVAQDQYYERLRTAMNSNQRPGMFFNHGSGSIAEFVEADLLVDLQEAFDANPELAEAFLPSMLETVEIDGGTYGVPIGGTQPVVLFYNKAVFEEVGVEPPTTWDEMLELIDTFKAEGIVPFSQPATQAWTLLMWWEYILDRVGGPEVFEKIAAGEWDEGWGDPAMLETTERIEDLVKRGAFGDNYAS